MRFTTSELADRLGGTLIGPDVTVDGASIDSRSLVAGQLFVPIVAARDGHGFIGAAVDAGAPAYLTTQPVAEARPRRSWWRTRRRRCWSWGGWRGTGSAMPGAG